VIPMYPLWALRLCGEKALCKTKPMRRLRISDFGLWIAECGLGGDRTIVRNKAKLGRDGVPGDSGHGVRGGIATVRSVRNKANSQRETRAKRPCRKTPCGVTTSGTGACKTKPIWRAGRPLARARSLVWRGRGV
jgi:hypothetical protein